MKEQLITFETAKLAKKKEFDWRAYTVYTGLAHHLNNFKQPFNWNSEADSDFSAPTQSLLQKWLREEYGIFIKIDVFDTYGTSYDFAVMDLDNLFDDNYEDLYVIGYGLDEDRCFNTYEQALEKGLQEALKLI